MFTREKKIVTHTENSAKHTRVNAQSARDERNRRRPQVDARVDEQSTRTRARNPQGKKKLCTTKKKTEQEKITRNAPEHVRRARAPADRGLAREHTSETAGRV